MLVQHAWNRVWRTGLGLGLAAASAAGYAQSSEGGVITYAPTTSTSVPTLSEWGMVAMALLLAVLAYRLLRDRLGGKPLASVVLAGALGLGLVSGVPGVRSAAAVVIVPSVSLSNSAGGTANVTQRGLNLVTNTSGVLQTITQMQASEGWVFESEFDNSPICQVGTVLSVGDSCYVNLRSHSEET